MKFIQSYHPFFLVKIIFFLTGDNKSKSIMPAFIYIINCNLSNLLHTYCFMCVPNSLLRIFFKLWVGSFSYFPQDTENGEDGNFTLNAHVFL